MSENNITVDLIIDDLKKAQGEYDTKMRGKIQQLGSNITTHEIRRLSEQILYLATRCLQIEADRRMADGYFVEEDNNGME